MSAPVAEGLPPAAAGASGARFGLGLIGAAAVLGVAAVVLRLRPRPVRAGGPGRPGTELGVR
jgi:hypothetical protein